MTKKPKKLTDILITLLHKLCCRVKTILSIILFQKQETKTFQMISSLINELTKWIREVVSSNYL